MSIERARAALQTHGIAGRIQEFTSSSATVALAAQALGCQEAHIAKTLSFAMGEGCILVVTAGDTKIDNPKFKAQFGTKAKMLAPPQVEQLVGHSIGGVCPFGINADVPVFLDASLRRFTTIYPACGSANSAIALTCDELATYAEGNPQWVDVCKLMAE